MFVYKTITVAFYSASAQSFNIQDEIGAVLIEQDWPTLTSGAAFRSQLWNDLHLVQAVGQTWDLYCSLGADVSIHGYSLTP